MVAAFRTNNTFRNPTEYSAGRPNKYENSGLHRLKYLDFLPHCGG
jgi:hypothetical protein